MQPEAIVKPTVATVCTSSTVQDEATGITYMDTITNSVGLVALESSHPVAQTPGLIIEDVTDLP